MATDAPKFDAELAWDIQEWAEPDQLDRAGVRALALFLTAKGYRKSSDRLDLNVGAVLSELFGRKP